MAYTRVYIQGGRVTLALHVDLFYSQLLLTDDNNRQTNVCLHGNCGGGTWAKVAPPPVKAPSNCDRAAVLPAASLQLSIKVH